MAFQPGESGNPKGAPRKAKIVTRELILALNEQAGDANKLRKVIDALIAKAEAGDVAAINAIMDRVDGKAIQAVEQEISVSDPLMDLISTIANRGKKLVDD
jgi:ribosomal protein L17